MLDGFHDREPRHAACCNKVYLTAFESGVLSCGVAVDKEYSKGSVDGEVVNELRGSAASRICKGATGTGAAHPFDEGVHFGPMVSKTQSMESTVGVQVPANGFRVKGNKNNII